LPSGTAVHSFCVGVEPVGVALRVLLGVSDGSAVGEGVSVVGDGAGAGVAEAGTTLRASAAVIGLTRSGTAAKRTD
jgi:hypothetical protein